MPTPTAPKHKLLYGVVTVPGLPLQPSASAMGPAPAQEDRWPIGGRTGFCPRPVANVLSLLPLLLVAPPLASADGSCRLPFAGTPRATSIANCLPCILHRRQHSPLLC